MWNPFKAIGNFFHSVADKVGAFVAKACELLKPFVVAVLSEAGAAFWKSSQTLIVAAIKYVRDQGLPTTEAKQTAFYDYMANAAKDEWTSLSTKEQNWMRETGLAILEKALAQGS